MNQQTQDIKAKGFAMDFERIKIGPKTLDDATIDLSVYKQVNNRLGNKMNVLKAIDNYDLPLMREISDFFYKTSGIYNRVLRYMAFMYNYDWFVSTCVSDKTAESKKMEETFYKIMTLLDGLNIKKMLGEIALKVLRYGVYYGYKIEQGNTFVLQELPTSYCRSRFFYGQKPAVEFNMKFFDDTFKNTEQRMKMLKLFPNEFSKGYKLYKEGKLPPQFMGDQPGWYLLDPDMTEKFNVNGEDFPPFISMIPLIIDVNEAQEVDKKKTAARLQKLIIQKMPLDKNGEMIFDIDEAQQFHQNAKAMLGDNQDTRVLTTFAETEVAHLGDTSAAAAQSDDLARAERQIYNEAGIPEMLFNTDGNIALEKSILNDAASMYNLLLQFEMFLNEVIAKYNKNKKFSFKVELLKTTIYNYQELSKMYKEQTQLGYSKVLPAVALGQSQRSVLGNAYFENEVLDLVHAFIPPMSSNQMNAESLGMLSGNNGEEKKTGRPTNEELGKPLSEKTIQNKESQS